MGFYILLTPKLWKLWPKPGGDTLCNYPVGHGGPIFKVSFFNENHLFLTTWDSFSMKSIVLSAFLVRKHDFRDLKKIKLPPGAPG